MIWLWLLATSFIPIANTQLFCSPVTAIGIDFARQLAPVPVEGPSVPDAAFRDYCISQAGSSEYCSQFTGYPNMHGRCLAYDSCLATCETYLDSYEYQNSYDEHLNSYDACKQGENRSPEHDQTQPYVFNGEVGVIGFIIY